MTDSTQDSKVSSDLGEELVYPITGEVVASDDPAGCVRLLGEIRTLEQQLKNLKAELTRALEEEFSRQGRKTIEVNGTKAELRGGSGVVWDIEVLEELRQLGLPEERMDELMQAEITYKVNANVAKQIAAANADYADVIERAKQRVPRPTYVSLG